MTIRLLPEVSFALREGTPVVALESSVLAQGLPVPSNREAAIRMTTAVRAHGAIPAITAVARGVPTVGLDDDELERFLARDGVIKVSARDIPVAVVRESDGATTVAAALLLARQAGVSVFATGGIGGVHRQPSFDESADLLELSRSPMVVVCAGAKAILDLPATLERLESLGVLVVGYCTDELPGFFTATTGLRLSARADSPADIAAIFRAHRALGRESAILVVQPPPSDAALPRKVVDSAVSDALERAQREGVRGASVTPYLLDAVQRATGGKSLGANLSLLEANAALAAEIAVALREEYGVARQDARGGG
ncbi:MAG TPA: pseudouridine-5'-phosphate glycosidase [Gemmatimonadaceae bacterium]|nr:pseudouridine-5'-phosphate glycosidase [Gemmatimonadaceae bacterium]